MIFFVISFDISSLYYSVTYYNRWRPLLVLPGGAFRSLPGSEKHCRFSYNLDTYAFK